MNPLLMAYANDAHLRAEQYAGTTAMFVMGRANFMHDQWQRCRDRGSEILKYEMCIERPDTVVTTADEAIYMGDSSKVPLWPWPTPGARSQFPNTKLIDIRPGSVFVSYYLDHVAEVIRSKRYSGLMLDGFGGQLWGAAGWNSWPAGERAEWTASAVDLARRLDEARRAEDPGFIIVGNNHWDIVPHAEKYVDGVMSENHPITNLAMQRIVAKPYGDLGHRRVLKLSRTTEEALAWSKVPGITHVCCTAENIAAGRGPYSYPTTPVVGYSRLGAADAELRARIGELERENARLLLVAERIGELEIVIGQQRAEIDATRARLAAVKPHAEAIAEIAA